MQYSVGAGARRSGPALRVPGLKLPAFRRFFGNTNNLIGAAILGPIVALAITAPWLPIPNPLAPDLTASLAGPSVEHPFGTDKLGRDVFSRTLAGLRVSLFVGFSAAAIALTGGMIIGTIAGFMGRTVDALISAVVDVFLAFPSLLLAI